MDPDHDLEALNREQLLAEVKRLRAGIRAHRDSTGHDLVCWHHPDFWGLLPERITPSRGRPALAEIPARMPALPGSA